MFRWHSNFLWCLRSLETDLVHKPTLEFCCRSNERIKWSCQPGAKLWALVCLRSEKNAQSGHQFPSARGNFVTVTRCRTFVSFASPLNRLHKRVEDSYVHHRAVCMALSSQRGTWCFKLPCHVLVRQNRAAASQIQLQREFCAEVLFHASEATRVGFFWCGSRETGIKRLTPLRSICIPSWWSGQNSKRPWGRVHDTC